MKERRLSQSFFAVVLAAAAVVAVAAGLVEYRFEPAIAGVQAKGSALEQAIQKNEADIRDAGAYDDLKRKAERDLRHLDRDADSSAATVSFIASLQAAAKRYHCRVTALAPSAEAVPKDRRYPHLAATAISIRARGTFAALLHLVEALPRQRSLVEIRGVQLSAEQVRAASSEPQLDATITATLYRLSPSIFKRSTDASNP